MNQKTSFKAKRQLLPAQKIIQYMNLLELYRLPQVCHYITSLEMPDKWHSLKWSQKQDNLVSHDNPSSYDFLVDLYHYKEIARLLDIDQIKKLKDEFVQLHEFDKGLTLEELILVLLKLLTLPHSSHVPYLINGIRVLYNKIQSNICLGKVTYSSFLEFYYKCQLITNTFDVTSDTQESAHLLEFEELKKDKHGFKSSHYQDVQHHDHAIKSVQYSEEFKWIFTLDEESNYFRVYNANNISLVRKVYCDSPKHKAKEIRIIDICYSDVEKTFAACCQDLKISFWTANNKFTHEYCFPCDKFGIQLKIYYIELTSSWITINQSNQIVEWKFVNHLDSSENQKTLLLKALNRAQQKVQVETEFDTSNNKGPMFTNSSVAEGKLWNFKSSAKISQIKELIEMKKLLIARFDQKITVWDPIKGSLFTTIKLPIGFSSAHTMAYSSRLNIILTGGFDQFVILWRLDQIKQDYTKLLQLEVGESGVAMSTADFFDSYGLLVTLDESGIMKGWDFEKWNLCLKVNLGCQIRNTLSSMVKLDNSRFVVVTQRLRIFEFPSKQPRRIKAKFQPLNQIEYDIREQKIVIGSTNEIYCLNINSSIVEEKYTPNNSNLSNAAYFFVSYNFDRIIVVNQEGQLLILGAKCDEDDKLNLLDDQKIVSCNYHQLYDLLTVWSSSMIRIFRGTETSNLENSKKSIDVQFAKIRQIQTNDINLVKIMPERDVIGILSKHSIMQFLSYSRLDILGQMQLAQIDVLKFDMLSDYNLIIVVDVFQDIWFIKHHNFQRFEFTLKIDRLTFSSNQLFVPFENISLETVFDHQVKQLTQTYLKNQQLTKQKQRNGRNGADEIDYFAQNQLGFETLYKLKDLQEKKRKMKGNLGIQELQRNKQSFRNAVYNVILLLKGASGLQSTKKSQTPLQQFKKSLQENSFKSSITIRSSDQQNILRSLVKSKVASSIKHQKNKSLDETEENQEVINHQICDYNLAHILEDFRLKYYIVLTNSLGQYDILNINSYLRNNFSYNNSEYQNKSNSSILSQTIDISEEYDDIQPIEKKVVCFPNQFEQHGIHAIQWMGNLKSSLINIKMVSFYQHSILFSFAKADSVIQAWDVSQIQDNSSYVLNPEYLENKHHYVRNYKKFCQLQRTIGLKEYELQEQLIMLQDSKNKCRLCFHYKKDEQLTHYSEPICEGLYVLPTENRVKWNLKDFNQNYRRHQMIDTIQLLKTMTSRWEVANKYQVSMLENKIQKERKMIDQLVQEEDISSRSSRRLSTPHQKNKRIEPQRDSKKNLDKSKFYFQSNKPEDSSFSSVTHKGSSISQDKMSKASPNRSVRSKTIQRVSQADSFINQLNNDDKNSKSSFMKIRTSTGLEQQKINKKGQKIFPPILHESVNEDEEDPVYLSRGKSYFINVKN